MTIDAFDISTGWGKAECPPLPDDNFTSEELAGAGFSRFDWLGYEDGHNIQIFSRGEDFLLIIQTFDAHRKILCPDLPSCLGLLTRLEPWFRMMHQDKNANIAHIMRRQADAAGQRAKEVRPQLKEPA